MRRLVKAGIIRGEHLVVDASLFRAYSNPRKADEPGEKSDSDASCVKETSTSQWVFRYKLQMISCANAEILIAMTVIIGKRGESPLVPTFLEKASRFPIPLRVVGVDGNYHAARLAS